MSDLRFDGRVAVITGAGGGLGKTYALDLASRGAKVVVNDLGGSADGTGGGSSMADKAVEEIQAAGGEAVANYDSVATPEGGAAIIQTAVDHFGKCDIVINNAGILRDKTFVKLEPADLEAVIDVHLKGAFYVSQPAFKVMKENGYGRFLFTSSAAGVLGRQLAGRPFTPAEAAGDKHPLPGTIRHALPLDRGPAQRDAELGV